MTATAGPVAPAPALSRPRLTRWLPLVLWILLTIALIATLPSLPWQRATEHLRRVEFAWLAGAVFANLMILPLWAAEWRVLVPGALRVGCA